MRFAVISLVLFGVGCESPKYMNKRPATLPRAATPTERSAILLEYEPLRWNTMLASGGNFRVAMDPHPLPAGKHVRLLGDIRSMTMIVAPEDWRVLRCGWQEPPLGDSPPCGELDPAQSRVQTQRWVDEALDSLRQQASVAGADVIRRVRCYAAGRKRRLWCEGRAGKWSSVAVGEPTAPPRVVEGTRFERGGSSLGAGALVGARGSQLVIGAPLMLRIRPVELSFIPASFPGTGNAAVGGELKWRRVLSRFHANVFVGAGVSYVNKNGGDLRDGGAMYGAVTGIGFQPDVSILFGVLQGFVDVQVGMSGASDSLATELGLDVVGPFVQASFGLITP